MQITVHLTQAVAGSLHQPGTPQTDGPGRQRTQRIGNRPNIRQMVASPFGVAPEADEAQDGQETLLT